jgi:putative nucleotidyltransferase with HDIG domain
MMHPNSMDGFNNRLEDEIRTFTSQLRQLESLPPVVLKVIEVAGSDTTNRGELTRLIESDQALAAKVLKVSNSAWMGSPGRISSLDRAMAMLGFDMVRNIALSVLVSHLFFNDHSDSGEVRARDLWYHSLACAVAAENLASRLDHPEKTAAFVAGLLHDLGKVVLLRWNSELYQQLARVAQAKHVSLRVIEQETLGIDHAEVAQILLEDWGFPQDLVGPVRDHHQLEARSSNGISLTSVIQCANSLCHHKRFGYSGHSEADLQLAEIEELTGLSADELKELSIDVIQRFDEAAALFSKSDSTPELYLRAVARANQDLAEMYQQLVERTREQELAEGELRKKEEQLNRAQRLEAVGQLAGGIAHDFNNFLTVIMGFGDLLREGISNDSPLRQHVDTIMSVAERAATLTRQLLAFSRRQVLKPRVIVLNTVITDVQRLLVRLIGEDIRLTTSLDPALEPVRVDPGGIEQVIVNLAVNARDAMVDGGVLTIETSNVEFTTEFADALGHLKPGRYVLIQFTDTGHGMSRETQERIFEPFFTTKKKGTGMGLATVYGIVKQSGGYIFVDSELGRGTTFRVYFEPVDLAVEQEPLHPAVDSFENGTETILIAEDEKEILTLVEKILRNVGYHVLSAQNGEEALQVADEYSGTIHLLLTDAVMPVVNGRELVERLRPKRPNMKILFMSGYTGTGILHRAVAGQDIAFISKPFTPPDLVRKVQQILESD